VASATSPVEQHRHFEFVEIRANAQQPNAGLTGSGFIVLAATLSSVEHIPVAAIALILGVDRFMSEARALTNRIARPLVW
jgi:Na+/H+-dicarboxylate symporter